MGRRAGRRRPTRKEKIALSKIHKKAFENVRPDRRTVSAATKQMVKDIAALMGQDPDHLYNKVSQ